MGLRKILGKTMKKPPMVMIASATFEQWKDKPAEDIQTFVKEMIEQIGKVILTMGILILNSRSFSKSSRGL